MVASSIGELLVGAAKLVGVNLVAANLLLDGIDAWHRVSVLFDPFGLYSVERTLVEVVFLAAGTAGAATGMTAGATALLAALAAEFGCETGEFVHGDIRLKMVLREYGMRRRE